MRLKKVLFAGVCLLLLVSCGGGSSSSSETTKVTVSVGQSRLASFVEELFTKSSSAIPPNVAYIKIVISAVDITPRERMVEVAGRTEIVETFEDVPNGLKRHFLAIAMSSDGASLYQGGDYADLDGNPKTISIMLSSSVVTCLNLVNQNRVLEARDACISCADSYGSAESNDANTARFLAALTRISAVWHDMQSDGNPNNGLNNLGDILDAFGCGASGRDPLHLEIMVCPETLPANAPTGAELQVFIANVLRPELERAIEHLDKVSQSFNVKWIEPFGGKQVESDYGDVLTLRSIAGTLLGSAIIENNYNLDADIAKAVNLRQTVQDFLGANPDFLKLKSSSELVAAKDLLNKASDDTLAAINWMQSETDNQNDDLISLLDIEPASITETKERINDFKASLAGPTTWFHDDERTQVSGTLDLTKFFVGVDARSLLPSYSGNIPGFFPDPTFKGIWTNYIAGSSGDPNHDGDGDGIPDFY